MASSFLVVLTASVGLATLTALAPSLARAQGDIIEDAGGQVRHIVVVKNKSRTIKFETPIGQAHIGSSAIADVLPVTDHTLYIQGKEIGTTNISVFDAKDHLAYVVDLEVTPDTSNLKSKIVASTGGRNIQVSSVNGEVVLSGQASDSVAAARAYAVAQGLSPGKPVINDMTVAPSQQVMLKVRILEVDRNTGRDLGVNWFVGNSNKAQAATGLGAFPPTTTTTTSPGGSTTSATANTGFTLPANPTIGVPFGGPFPGTGAAATAFGSLLANVINTHGVSVDLLLSALETRGLVKALAEPDLVALSGTKASFLAGGQIAVPTLQPGAIGSAATVSVQYFPYGVQLNFLPTVLDGGLINLQLTPEVSEIDTTSSVTIGGTTVPNLIDRKAETSIELRDGQSFAIAGLLQANSNEAISQLPYLGSIPVLGALFRSTSYQKNESELVIIVTPHLVRPSPPGKDLATPFDNTLQANDIDLFLMGNLERKKRYVDYVTSGGQLKGPYGHILSTQ